MKYSCANSYNVISEIKIYLWEILKIFNKNIQRTNRLTPADIILDYFKRWTLRPRLFHAVQRNARVQYMQVRTIFSEWKYCTTFISIALDLNFVRYLIEVDLNEICTKLCFFFILNCMLLQLYFFCYWFGLKFEMHGLT